jgi:hypothetical protein
MNGIVYLIKKCEKVFESGNKKSEEPFAGKRRLRHEDFRPEIETCETFFRRHITDIPRIKL